MSNFENGRHPIKHRLKSNTECVAELGHRNIDRNDKYRVDDLRFIPMLMQSLPKFFGNPVSVLTNLLRIPGSSGTLFR